VTDFTVTETQTSTGLVRQQIRTLRTFGPSELDLSGKQRSLLTLTGVFQNTGTTDQEYLIRITSPNRVPTQYDLFFELGDGVDSSLAANTVSLTAKKTVNRRDVII